MLPSSSACVRLSGQMNHLLRAELSKIAVGRLTLISYSIKLLED